MNKEEKLKEILAATLHMELADVKAGLKAEDVKEWDSLQQMNIIVAIEEEFGIAFEEAESILLKEYKSLLNAIQIKTSL